MSDAASAASAVGAAGSGGGISGGGVASNAITMSAATAMYAAARGLLPRAQLLVPKAYSLGKMSKMTAAIGKNDSMALMSLVGAKKVKAKASVASTGAKAVLKQTGGPIAALTMAATTAIQQTATVTALGVDNYSVMEVQYNPKSITFSANGGGMLRAPQAGDAGAYQMQITSDIMRINLNVDLVFEDINLADAFHLEGLQMNGEELLKTASSVATNLTAGGYSVQNQCEGLLSLLNFKRLKQVVFLWSDMFFHGELTNVDVRYKMFNKLGHPILAEVRLTIQQNDSSNSIRYASDVNMWDTAFDIAFGERGTAAATKMGGLTG